MLVPILVVVALLVSACGGSSKAKSPSTSGTTTTSGVRVSGAYGTSPTVVVPTTAAPASLTQQTLAQGTGTAVASGDTVVANYVGQTWAQKNGKANVFDSSFTRGAPAAFVIGLGQVIPGWDKTLLGKNLGSRVVLTIPPSDGYGSAGQSSAGITGTDTLVFVIDLVAFAITIAVARALVKNAPIILLDEATAALDSESEQQVQEAIEHLCQNRTTIVIAHRLHTIMHADAILVVEGGEIVERGRHDDLLRRGGRYASFFRLQHRDAGPPTLAPISATA